MSTAPAPSAVGTTPMPSLDRHLLRDAGTALGAASVAAAAGAIGLYATSRGGTSEMVNGNGATNLVLGASLGVLGIVLLRARPRNSLGWIVAGTGLANALAALGDAYAQHAFASSRPWHLGVFAAWVSSWAWVVGFVPAFTVLLARYPTGAPTSRSWRVVDRLGWALTALAGVGLALASDAFSDVAPARYAPFDETANRVAGVIFPVSFVVGLAVGLVASIGTLVRLYRATSPVREQLAWLVVCIVPVTVSTVVAPSVVTLCLIPLVPLGIGLGILRYRLLDIQLVLRRTLLYGVLTAAVVGVYIGVVAGLTALVPHGPFPRVLAAAAIVVGIRPGYDLFRRAVDRYVYGDRHDPVRAVSRLGRELATGDQTEGPLPKAVRAIAEALRVPYVSLSTDDGDVTEHGTPTEPLHVVQLRYGGEPVGTLSVARRTPNEPLRADDVALLDLLAGPIGITVHATRLAAEVAASRDQLLNATEQERSRLRHDLHDGLGASLTGVGLGLEAAQLAADSPETLRPLLERLRAEVAESLTDVRRLVDGLRPPALDTAGLVDALRDHAATVTARNAGSLVVDVEAPSNLPALPKELEVVAYRITLEALTNVVRHADARRCSVRLCCSPQELRIEIHDDGKGISESSRPGVGLDSMRARAAQLGGSVEVRRIPAGGTAVIARLPAGTP